MDEMDLAQGHNENFQAYCLEHHLRRDQSHYTGTECIDCGEEIALLRREVLPNCLRCYCCQTYFETRRPM